MKIGQDFFWLIHYSQDVFSIFTLYKYGQDFLDLYNNAVIFNRFNEFSSVFIHLFMLFLSGGKSGYAARVWRE